MTQDDKNLGRRGEENAFWTILGYMISGLFIWGGIGWGLDRWLGTEYFLMGRLSPWAAIAQEIIRTK